MRHVLAILVVALSGCATQLHGVQSASGGSATTATSSAVAASASASGARAGFSSGAPVPPAAPGGQVSLGRSGSAALILGIVIVDAVGQLVSRFGAPPAPAAVARPASIADTCSCYGYQPASAETTPMK